jgi:hypothetical protein
VSKPSRNQLPHAAVAGPVVPPQPRGGWRPPCRISSTTSTTPSAPTRRSRSPDPSIGTRGRQPEYDASEGPLSRQENHLMTVRNLLLVSG